MQYKIENFTCKIKNIMLIYLIILVTVVNSWVWLRQCDNGGDCSYNIIPKKNKYMDPTWRPADAFVPRTPPLIRYEPYNPVLDGFLYTPNIKFP